MQLVLHDLQWRYPLRLMLTVYTYKVDRPVQALDLSLTPLDELTDTALAFADHQTSGTVWFGYLEGWMLTPRDEALLRRVLRKFDCFLVTCEPLSLSHAWQNEIRTIYTAPPNGPSDTHHDGRAVHTGSSTEHGPTGPRAPARKRAHQAGKAGGTSQG